MSAEGAKCTDSDVKSRSPPRAHGRYLVGALSKDGKTLNLYDAVQYNMRATVRGATLVLYAHPRR
jgi:hypothetical protein